MNQEREFLIELEALSRKYKIQVSGCGCCGSPSLYELEDKDLVSEAGYASPCGSLDFGWAGPQDHDWDKVKQNLVKEVK